MNYIVAQLNVKEEYEQGEYYMDTISDVYRIIYDSDRGYSLLQVSTGFIKSDFYETIQDLVINTNISHMRHINQVNKIQFKVD